MNYVLPGMGATQAMYAGPWRSLPGTVFLDWPDGEHFETIPELAGYLINKHSIVSGDAVIGSSLGGMVACEISKLVQLEHLILLGSAKRKEEISLFLRWMTPMINLAPIQSFQHTAGKLATELTQMFAMTDPQFIRNMSKAIFRWEGLGNESQPFRIHGTKDSIIPLPKDADVTLDGGHLIAMTHPEECVEPIRNLLKL